MAGGVTLSVRQVGSYPLVTAAGPGDLVLIQPGGLGNPYAAISSSDLVATTLASAAGPALGVGYPNPPDDAAPQVFSGQFVMPNGGNLLWNAYADDQDAAAIWQPGGAGGISFGPTSGFSFNFGTATTPVEFTQLMGLGPAGNLVLPRGTLTVARDPGAAMEVATMGWVGNSTVASFNGRRGVVQLTSADIYGALCLDSCIATENWVNAQIQASIQLLLANHPFVFGWNGRTGSVYLTLADITCVFFQPGQQPVTQTPPLTSNDYSIPNTAWVVEYITNEFAGSGTTIATQQWVLANTVNSFNGRTGPVLLNLTDITAAGGAPLVSPQLGGTPTAPTQAVGNATSAIATTAFVWNAVQESTTGVISWNGRTGTVTLEAADINDVGGALLASPAFTGTPTAPTAAIGTATPQLATCAFVLNEVQAIGSGVTTFNTRSGNVTLLLGDVTGAGGAPLASPGFTGTPTVPTPVSPVAATTTIPNTSWVVQYVTLSSVASFNTRTGNVTLNANDITAAGGLANPNVALTGTPTAPTAVPGTNTTQIATTAFVAAALSNVAGVTSWNGRAGPVVLQAADLSGVGGALLASPQFTGSPTAPTAALGTSSTQLATTAFVINQLNALGGGITVSQTPPPAPISGEGWYNTLDGQTYIWEGSAWAVAVNPPTPDLSKYLLLTGGTLTGPLGINVGAGINGLTVTTPSGSTQIASGISTGAITASGVINGNAGISAAGLASTAQVTGVTGSFTSSFQINGSTNIGNPTAWALGQIATLQVQNSGNNAGAFYTNAATAAAIVARVDTTNAYLIFFGFGANLVGSITTNTTSVTYNTTSDGRLKENVAPLDVDYAGAMIDRLAPVSFEWIEHPEVGTDYGFIAQDVEAVFPHAVTEGVGEPGEEDFKPWGMDNSKLVPLMIAELQALRARVAALEAQR